MGVAVTREPPGDDIHLGHSRAMAGFTGTERGAFPESFTAQQDVERQKAELH